MILLYILLGIFALLFLILMSNIRIIVKYCDSVYCGIVVLGFKIKLAPRKSKKKTIKKIKKSQSKHKSAPAKSKKSPLAEFTEDLELADFIELLKHLLNRVYKHALCHLKVKIKRLEITVGDEYPDRAALNFGVVNSGVSWLLEYFDTNTKLDPLDGRNIYVRCDFGSQKTTADILIEFKIRVIHILVAALNFFLDFIKLKEMKNNVSIMKGNKNNERK